MIILQLCEALLLIFKGAIYFFWDTVKALVSPFKGVTNSHDYASDICLITGAAQGLGRLLAKELARRQAVLVLWDIQEEKLQDVVDEVYRETGAEAHAYVCDCSSREDISRVANQVKREVGDVTILINNVGVMSGQTIVDSKAETIENTFRVNTLSHFWVKVCFAADLLTMDINYLNVTTLFQPPIMKAIVDSLYRCDFTLNFFPFS